MLRAVGILGVSAALVLPAVAAGKTPAKKTTHTAAGMAAAARAVLATGDLGSGWQTGGPGAQNQSLNCGSATPAEGAVEIGKAVSPAFEQSSVGPFVSQAVFVYATPAQAKQVWDRTTGERALDCLAASVIANSTKDVSFKVLHKQTLAAPLAGTRSAAYRVVAKVHATAQTITAYVDMFFVGRGSAVAEVSYAAFQDPIARTVEVALARTLASRL